MIMANLMQPVGPLNGPIRVRETRSIEIECFHCKHRGLTEVRLIDGAGVWLVVLSLFLLGFCFILPWFYCCVPCCITDLKEAEHRCQKCHTVVAFKK